MSVDTVSTAPRAVDLRGAWVDRPCSVCGSTDTSRVFAAANFDLDRLDRFAFASRKLPEYMHYRLLECPACDLLYASPIPPPEALARGYEEADFDSGEEARHAARTYAGRLPAIARRLPDRAGALDIGTGDGAFLVELLAHGFTDVVGVEPSAAPIKAARADIRPRIRQDLFRADAYEPGRFALITCFQTIEHVSEPAALARDAARLLKPGGALYLVCHNRRALSAKVLGRKSPIFDIEHLQLFSPRSAAALLQRCGFVDVRVATIVNRYPLHYWAKLLPMPAPMKRAAMATLRGGLGRVPLPMPAGNLAVVGYTPARGG